MDHTVLVLRMANRIWKETKQEPGTAGPGNKLGYCLISFHFLWVILSTSTVNPDQENSSYCSALTKHICTYLQKAKEINNSIGFLKSKKNNQNPFFEDILFDKL